MDRHLAYFLGTILALFLTLQSASGETSKSLSGRYIVRQIPQSYKSVPVSTVAARAKPSRIMNLRVHPLAFAPMIVNRDTRASLRVDVDVIAADRFTIGPSLAYRSAQVWDDEALAGGNIHFKDESTLDLGLLSNIYLSGSSREGGFIARPHVYWTQVRGMRSDGAGGLTDSASETPGWRAGAEIVYQLILPVGLNFEIGGGFTYHLSPFNVDYGNNVRSAPDSQFAPTISAGVGWAF